MTSATTTSAATTSSSRAKSASEFSGGNLSNRSTDSRALIRLIIETHSTIIRDSFD